MPDEDLYNKAAKESMTHGYKAALEALSALEKLAVKSCDSAKALAQAVRERIRPPETNKITPGDVLSAMTGDGTTLAKIKAAKDKLDAQPYPPETADRAKALVDLQRIEQLIYLCTDRPRERLDDIKTICAALMQPRYEVVDVEGLKKSTDNLCPLTNADFIKNYHTTLDHLAAQGYKIVREVE